MKQSMYLDIILSGLYDERGRPGNAFLADHIYRASLKAAELKLMPKEFFTNCMKIVDMMDTQAELQLAEERQPWKVLKQTSTDEKEIATAFY